MKMNILQKFIRNVIWHKRMVGIWEGLLLTATIFSAYVLSISLFDYIISIPAKIRFLLLIVFSLSLLAAIIKFILIPLIQKIKMEEVAFYIQRRYPYLKDYVVNAVLLGRLPEQERNWVSDDLIEKSISEIEHKLSRIDPKHVIETKRLKDYTYFCIIGVSLLCSLYFLPPRIVFHSWGRIFMPLHYARISEGLSIIPGDKTITKGNELRIDCLTKRIGRPMLKFKFRGKPWSKIRMDEADTESNRYRHTYLFKKLDESLNYCVKWKDIQSPVYKIEVIDFPIVGNIKLRYTFPEYTGIEPVTENRSNGHISALRGTRVKISAQANKPIREAFLLTNDGKKILMEIRRELFIEGSLIITNERFYWFEIKDNFDLSLSHRTKYYIDILEDKSPWVKILAPQQDMTVSQDSQIELTMELGDDYGINEVNLIYYANNEEEKSINIARSRKGIEEKKLSYNWFLQELRLIPGSRINYHIEVLDNDAISGPKRGKSKTLALEVFSYEKEHLELTALQSVMQEQLLKLLDNQIGNRKELEEIKNRLNTEKGFSKENMNNIIRDQSDINAHLEDIMKLIKDIIPRLEIDPYSNPSIPIEYSSIESSLKYLYNEKAAPIISLLSGAMTSQNRKQLDEITKALENQDNIIRGLERVSLLADDLITRGRMEDVINNARNLQDAESDFARELEGIGDLKDEESLKILREELKKISELMRELYRSLKELPETLPEEFINRDSIKELDLGKIVSQMKNLGDEIDARNLESAIEQARRLSMMLQDMFETLQEASNYVNNQMGSNMANMGDESMMDLNYIIEKEKAIIDDTEELDKKRLEKLLIEQNSILKGLADKQSKAISEASIFRDLAKKHIKNKKIIRDVDGRVRSILRFMEKSSDELDKMVVHESKKLVEDTISNCQDINGYIKKARLEKEKELKDLENDRAKLKSKKKDLTKQEFLDRQSILNKKESNIKEAISNHSYLLSLSKNIIQEQKEIKEGLDFRPEDWGVYFTDREKKEIGQIRNIQKDVRVRTDTLKEKIKFMSQKSTAFGYELMENLSSASYAMGEAEDYLKSRDTREALTNEREALWYLSKCQEGLRDSLNTLQTMVQKLKDKGVGFIQPKGGTLPGGRLGFREGYVELPSKEEYQVPKGLRNEIMESIKERYPQIYKKLVEEYYRRLIE